MRFLLLIAAILIQGCQSSSPVQDSKVLSESELNSRIEHVLAGMAERSDLMKKIHGWGVIELQWKDGSGSHFEQGDLEFWLDGSEHLAVRISKLGDTYFWLGTDGAYAWVFDLSERPRRLMVSSMDSIQQSDSVEGSWLSIMDMVRMMRAGLGVSPPPHRKDVLSLSSVDDGDWSLVYRDSQDPNRRIALLLDPDTWRPVQISLLDSDGTQLLTAGTRSSRTKRVDIPGRTSLASPVVSAVIEVRDHSAADALSRFVFEGISADLSDQPLERLFDLSTLKSSLRPDIEGPLFLPGSEDDDSSTR